MKSTMKLVQRHLILNLALFCNLSSTAVVKALERPTAWMEENKTG